MTKNKKEFVDVDIFRASSKLFSSLYSRVRNCDIDIKRTVGDSLLKYVCICGGYCKLSYKNAKNNKKMKLIYMIKAKQYISAAEFNLNIMVSCGNFPGKKKDDEDEYIYLNGGSEISMNFGELVMQLDNFISSLEKNFTKEELDDIYENINIDL